MAAIIVRLYELWAEHYNLCTEEPGSSHPLDPLNVLQSYNIFRRKRDPPGSTSSRSTRQTLSHTSQICTLLQRRADLRQPLLQLFTRDLLMKDRIALRLKAIALRLEAIVSRLEAIAIRFLKVWFSKVCPFKVCFLHIIYVIMFAWRPSLRLKSWRSYNVHFWRYIAFCSQSLLLCFKPGWNMLE